jgi:DNA replication protein DnaC
MTTKESQPTALSARFRGFQTLGDPELERLRDAAVMFAQNLNVTEPYWLSLGGQSGTGKTLLAKAIRRWFLDVARFRVQLRAGRVVGNTALWVDWRTLAEELHNREYGRVGDVCHEWFVVIEDLGVERDVSGNVANVADRIFNARLGKWTLVTTNKTLAQIGAAVDVRVASRMIRDKNHFVWSDAPDWNLR